MATVTVRKLSDETKGLLAARAQRNRHSLEEELRRILDEAARTEAANPDALEPLGSFIVRVTRPGYDDVADVIDAQRKIPDRPLPSFN
jgi:lipase chaperone LimK